jgi:hypothetical protein
MKLFEKKMLKDLYESVNGLFAFTFYSRYNIEPEDMFSFIEKYEKKGVLIYDNDKLDLTKEGREIVLKQLFYKNKTKDKFSKIPSEFIVSKLKINEPYLPNISSVSADILKN